MEPLQPSDDATRALGYPRQTVHVLAPTATHKPWLNLALFAATFFTCAMASAWTQDVSLLSHPSGILTGFPFAITVMTILLSHEMAHYVVARAHRVDASLPFFLPAPPIFWFGTFGAFIRMRTMPPHRRALFDIGAAGPWAGFLVALPALIVGLSLSTVEPLHLGEEQLVLGDSLLFSWLTQLVLGVRSNEVSVLLHPIALAGWFGLLVTCLNLLPVGQLDGGHIAYAVFGRHHRWIARGVLTFVIVLGIGGWFGWFVWASLFMIVGLDHPPTSDPIPLDRPRQVAAALTFVLLLLTFMPEPIAIVESTLAPAFEGQRTPVRTPAAPLPSRVGPI
jgi:membrane-associated protease RseP (regulator of RpoE activity)